MVTFFCEFGAFVLILLVLCIVVGGCIFIVDWIITFCSKLKVDVDLIGIVILLAAIGVFFHYTGVLLQVCSMITDLIHR